MAQRKAFEQGFRFATGLIGGCCRLCEECEGVKAGLEVPSCPIDQSVTWTGLVLL